MPIELDLTTNLPSFPGSTLDQVHGDPFVVAMQQRGLLRTLQIDELSDSTLR